MATDSKQKIQSLCNQFSRCVFTGNLDDVIDKKFVVSYIAHRVGDVSKGKLNKRIEMKNLFRALMGQVRNKKPHLDVNNFMSEDGRVIRGFRLPAFMEY